MTTKKKLTIGIAAGAVVLIALIVVVVVILQPASAPPVDEPAPAIQTTPEPKTPEPKKLTSYPLTGLPLELDATTSEAQRSSVASALTSARPLCIKIENSYDARPQLGFSKADVVYETIAEGGITRFNCIFQSNLPPEVGPVRSARNSDISIVPQYQGVLFYSGANGLVLAQIAAAGLASITDGANGFHRVDFREAPHNLYLWPEEGYKDAEWNGHAITLTNPPTLEFLDLSKQSAAAASGSGSTSSGSGAAGSGSGSPASSTSSNSSSSSSASSASGSGSSGSSSGSATSNPPATPVGQLTVPFSEGFYAEWLWSGEGTSGKWLRSMAGPTTDAADGSQISATNVVVLWAIYAPDAAGGTTWEIGLNGTGKASIFTQGGRIDGTWETNGDTPPRFRDANGKTIFLTPGNTWFEVLPTDIDVTVE